MPCHRNMFLTWSPEAVSGDNCCVSVQLGCLQYNVCIFQKNYLSH